MRPLAMESYNIEDNWCIFLDFSGCSINLKLIPNSVYGAARTELHILDGFNENSIYQRNFYMRPLAMES